MADLKTYRGNCHCAAYVFEVKLPELETVTECNCSVCSKRGVLFANPQPGNLTFVKGDVNTLSNYAFGDKKLNHKFCPHCGVSLMIIGHMVPLKPGEVKEPTTVVNVRAIQNIDVWGLKVRSFNGGAIPPLYDTPKFTGVEPQDELEGGMVATGSCHCGAVKLAVKTKPLDASFDGRVIECNCSICGRYGAVWIYPKHEYVVIEGEENLSHYSMGSKVFAKGFCKTCGVPIDNKSVELTDEQVEALPEDHKKWYGYGREHHVINVRALNGVDMESLKTTRLDGWNAAKPMYVNP